MELKLCPWCDCDQIQYREEKGPRFYRYCRNCHARGPFGNTYEEAEELWNTRAEDTKNSRLIERLEALFDNYGTVTGGQMRVDLRQIIDEANHRRGQTMKISPEAVIPSRYGICYNCSGRPWCPFRTGMAIEGLKKPELDKNYQVVKCDEFKSGNYI